MFPSQIIKLHLKDHSFAFPLWPRQTQQTGSSAMPWWVYADSRLHNVWIWNTTKNSQLNPIGFDIALIWCWISYTMKSLLIYLFYPLSLPSAPPQSMPHSAKDQDIKYMYILLRVTHNYFSMGFKYFISCFIVSQRNSIKFFASDSACLIFKRYLV